VARPGVGYLAVRSGAPVVPVAVHGSAEMVRHAARQRRPVVQVSFGEPLSFPSAGAGPLNRAQWLLATEQIRIRLAELVRTTDPNSDGGGAPW
jgi:1-acyl-sn-glycerol-3-phosphate acyltransferase